MPDPETPGLRPARQPQERAARRAAGARAGYAVAALIDALLLYLVNVAPGWQAVPFLTADVTEVLGWVNASLALGLVANLVYLGRPEPWVRPAGEVLTSAVSVVVLVQLWRVFPVDFSGVDVGDPALWEVLARAVLALGVLGAGIAVVVNLVRLLRALGGQSAP